MVIGFKRDKKEALNDELRRKWGFTDARACYECDTTQKYLLGLVQRVGLEHQKPSSTKYFTQVIDYRKRWDDGEFRDWRDYWITNEELVERDAGRLRIRKETP